MNALRTVLVLLAIGVIGLPPGTVRATQGMATTWQSDYAETACAMVLAAAADCSLCHTAVPALNPYGQDVFDFGFGWFVIEPRDSDGDGRTNREEITIDCSLPGDATSPLEATSWSRIRALYRDVATDLP